MLTLTAISASFAADPLPAWKVGDAPLHYTLRGPFDTLLKQKQTSPDEKMIAAGELTYPDPKNPAGKPITIPVRLKARGHTAFMEGECSFPKLTLLFEPLSVVGTPFEGLKKIKIGTHCGTEKNPEKWLSTKSRVKNPVAVAREAYAYEMLEHFEVTSLSAKLVTINYEDTGTHVIFAEPAFLLDDEDEFAKRMGAKILEYSSYSEAGEKVGKGPLFQDALTEGLRAEQVARVQLAEAVLGNFDFLVKFSPEDDSTDGTSALSNLYVLESKEGGAKHLIPYDFDLASVVTGKTGLEILGIPPAPGMTAIEEQIRNRILATQAAAPGDAFRAAVTTLLAKKGKVLTALENAALDEAGKSLYRSHCAFFFQELEKH